jgi:hypothetical protein
LPEGMKRVSATERHEQILERQRGFAVRYVDH